MMINNERSRMMMNMLMVQLDNFVLNACTFLGFQVYYMQFLMAMGRGMGAIRNVGIIGNENEVMDWE